VNEGSGGRTDLEFLDRKISELYAAGAYAAAVEVATESNTRDAREPSHQPRRPGLHVEHR